MYRCPVDFSVLSVHPDMSGDSSNHWVLEFNPPWMKNRSDIWWTAPNLQPPMFWGTRDPRLQVRVVSDRACDVSVGEPELPITRMLSPTLPQEW